ncbi:MAG: phosphotransferase family protein [Anaerolineae bacterium]
MNVFEKLPSTAREALLRPLLDYLARAERRADGRWGIWRIANIDGGRNNRLYRASCNLGDLVVKFTIRDERDRAGREFGALTALRQAGLKLAPAPLLLDRDRYALPVVVQTWLEGDVVDIVPASDADDVWEKIVRHLVAVHSVTPDTVAVELRTATINAYNVTEGRQLIREHAAYIPPEERPSALRELLHRFEATTLPDWEEKRVALIRLDNNTLNYVRRPETWLSVDWENSGWGDPAFDVANLMTHAAYLEVPASRWAWVVERYCELSDDATASTRIWSYNTIMAVWWVVRMARYLYEMPRGLDARLVEWSDEWLAEMQVKYERYVQFADGLL